MIQFIWKFRSTDFPGCPLICDHWQWDCPRIGLGKFMVTWRYDCELGRRSYGHLAWSYGLDDMHIYCMWTFAYLALVCGMDGRNYGYIAIRMSVYLTVKLWSLGSNTLRGLNGWSRGNMCRTVTGGHLAWLQAWMWKLWSLGIWLRTGRVNICSIGSHSKLWSLANMTVRIGHVKLWPLACLSANWTGWYECIYMVT